MANIAPFRALRYDSAQVPVAQAVTQPYDKISPEMQERYYASSPYNLVRIILGKKLETDHTEENIYTRAAGFFQDWRKSGALRQDNEPSIYRYVQRFTAPGSPAGSPELERRGFIALGKIEEYSAGIVHRHEQTLAKPKADRLDLLRATRAHFGQIFMLYSDPASEVDQALAGEAAPEVEVRDEYGVVHQLWKVSDPGRIAAVREHMRDKKLIIADGHHRYETALNYRNQRRAQSGTGDAGEAPHDYLMMTFINMDSPGLLVLPTHRVVHGLASFSPENFREGARTYFSVDEVDPQIEAARATQLLKQAGLAGTALLAVTEKQVFLLDTPRAAGAKFFAGLSLRQQSLDVVQLHKVVLEGLLELSEESIRNQQNLSYVRDAAEAMAKVRNGSANIAFLMNPVRMQQVRDIAFGGEVLPQKSTDFYPKLLSGLTIYAVE